MRMWMVNPHILCRKHLLGEHVELHMLAGTILRGKRLDGFIEKGLLQPESMDERHTALTAEMERRGYTHKSPLDAAPVLNALAGYPEHIRTARVDAEKSLRDLTTRCPDCAARARELR